MTIDIEAIKGRCNRAAALDKSAIYCLIEADIPDLITEIERLRKGMEKQINDKNIVNKLDALKVEIKEELVSIYRLIRDNHPVNHGVLIVLNDYEVAVGRMIDRLFSSWGES